MAEIISWYRFFVRPEVLLLAFGLDLLLGDPRWLPHPVVGIGKAALFLERPLRRLGRALGGVCGEARGEFLAGAGLVALVAGGSFLIPFALLLFLSAQGPGPAAAAVSVFFIYSAIAVRSLAEHARAVSAALAEGKLAAARRAVGMMVGRDVHSLDEAEVARAAVESVAENTSDGIVAPLFYAALGGAPLALAYRAVNTLDAMYGHKTKENLHFGRAAARLDDFLNYLPARLTALLFLAAALVLGERTGPAWRVLKEDGAKHPSPNSGRPEAAVAGIFNIRLGGANTYHGKKEVLPFLNPAGRPPAGKDIEKTVRLMRIAGYLALFGGVLAAAAASLAG